MMGVVLWGVGFGRGGAGVSRRGRFSARQGIAGANYYVFQGSGVGVVGGGGVDGSGGGGVRGGVDQ